MRLWTLPTKPTVQTLAPSFKIAATARSADGKTLVTAARNGRTVKKWDIASGALLATEETEIEWGDWLAISPDGTTLATQTNDHKILLWNSKTRQSKSLSGHSAEVTSLAFSPDGRLLASGSADGTARLWDIVDIQNARECGRFSHEEGRVYCVRFSPDGKTLAAGTTHDGVTLWDVASEKKRRSFPSRDGKLTCWPTRPRGTESRRGVAGPRVRSGIWIAPQSRSSARGTRRRFVHWLSPPTGSPSSHAAMIRPSSSGTRCRGRNGFRYPTPTPARSRSCGCRKTRGRSSPGPATAT